ncbi:hypothetical protein OPT61_g220 [Boeremia exigua]|uniref:Uncharacterized protein n=1 Tax=Boeremia exigua TaxID=749465 RepID=A0ACC2IUV6_9PLEO|nr:hypothetical protein OPT61_g220 [Boeremia exigua]
MNSQPLGHEEPHASVFERYELLDQGCDRRSDVETAPKMRSVARVAAQVDEPKINNERFSPFKLAADVAAILVPLALLGFTVAVSRLNGREVHQATFAAWQDAINVLATLFPILFASIIGRLAYEVARWKLETGSTLQVLEQLLGSRSVGSVVTTQFQLRAFNLLGVLLIVIWACSPLGSQSILRTLSSGVQPQETTSRVVYYDSLNRSGLSDIVVVSPNSLEIANTFFQYLTVLFSATLMTSDAVKVSSMDQWRSVKIPFLDAEAFLSDGSASGWNNVTRRNSLEQFVSVAGLPVTDIPFGNTTLSVESSYVELDCFNVSKITSYPPDLGIRWWSVGKSPGTFNMTNGTWKGVTQENTNDTTGRFPGWHLALDTFIDQYWLDAGHESPGDFMAEQGIEANPTRLLLQSKMATNFVETPISLIAVCDVRQRYVESVVLCERPDAAVTERNCTVTAQRPSQKVHATELISHLNFPQVWTWITRRLPMTGGGGESKRADLVTQYLNDPKLNNMTTVDTSGMFNDIDTMVFSRRLSQILNTYLLLSELYLSAPGGSMAGSFLGYNVTTSATTTTLFEVYTVSSLWISLGGVSCSVLFLGGLLGVVFRHLAVGPEVLGYASTAIRDSRHMELSPKVATMNGLEITKAMKDQRVRYGLAGTTQEGQPSAGVGLQRETTRITRSHELSRSHLHHIMSELPTLVFIPGAWHKPICYTPIIERLERQDLRCKTVELPSTTGDPAATFKDDLDAARATISHELAQGRNVVIVAHSYGGMVGNSAIKGFARPRGQGTLQEPQNGYVIGLVLIASGFTLTGLAFMDPFFGIPPPMWRVNKATGFADIVTPPREFFYHDLPEEEADYWISQLTTQSLKSLFEGGEYTYAGWRDVPVWYIGTIEDHGLPVVAQRLNVGFARGLGAVVEHRELRSSHSPFLSQPDEVVEMMLEAVGGFAARPKSQLVSRSQKKEVFLPAVKLLHPLSWVKYGLPLMFGRAIGWGVSLYY